MDVPHSEIVQRVQMLLRRDLKLGPDTPIAPDMPFFGGDIDLDSLDILLLVTSVEKEFGVKIPSEKVGKDVFQSVATLVSFIERNLDGSPDAAAGPAAFSGAPGDPLSRLPQGPEFRFVSRVTALQPGALASGAWDVRGDEDFFKGHFPGNPLVPGVLIGEALAQICGLAGPGGGRSGALASIDLRFNKPVAPPATIALQAKLLRVMGELQQFDVAALVGNDAVASGTITLHRPAL
jgi:3-hydroxyacyl-[acyl-carrier-protein] dehydratase